MTRGCDESPREGRVPRDVDVLALFELSGRDFVARLKELCGLTKVIASAECSGIGLGDLGLGAKASVNPLHCALDRSSKEPTDEAESKEVLRALGVSGLDACVLTHLLSN